MAAMTEVCIKRYEAFNTAGHASKIKVVPLDEMARGYRG
jgi:fructose-bisphosphate aldolase class II